MDDNNFELSDSNEDDDSSELLMLESQNRKKHFSDKLLPFRVPPVPCVVTVNIPNTREWQSVCVYQEPKNIYSRQREETMAKEQRLTQKKDALYGFGSDEEDEGSNSDMESDIEDEEDKLPDDRAWGQKRRSFYNTDYIDQDYTGRLGADDAEAAEMEENEARNIQKRLMEQLTDEDFSLVDFRDIPLGTSQSKTEVIVPDLTQLSKRQKLEFFKKESPEFENLVGDFVDKITEVQERIYPILTLAERGTLGPSPALDFLETKLTIILNYCVNIVFYVLLKTKRISVRDHPVLKCLLRYRQLLSQLEPVEEEIIRPQVDKLLELFKHVTTEKKDNEENEDFELGNNKPSKVKKAKRILNILKKTIEKSDKLKDIKISKTIDKSEVDDSGNGSVIDVDRVDVESSLNDEGELPDVDQSGKRAITYEMAKNKGLTPKRSKEQRNPRVKHRNKFRKAKIRRRGQVRMARTEIPVYTGEPTGIKIGLKKGRKLM